MSFLRGLRGNAHALNYLLISAAVVVPALGWALARAPAPGATEAVLNTPMPPAARAAARASARAEGARVVGAWESGRGGSASVTSAASAASARAPMLDDAVVADLLRGGRGRAARAHGLSGALAAAEDAELRARDPLAARAREALRVTTLPPPLPVSPPPPAPG